MPQTDIMKKNMPLKEWLPLLGMTFSAFVVNTSEFMPIGLLTISRPISESPKRTRGC